MLDEVIIDDADALAREDGQYFAVALAFRYHAAVLLRAKTSPERRQGT
jgi:hypothetical protein